MKILYIGNERRSAEVVATALRSIAGNVTVSWTTSLDHCPRYLAQNRDLAALVIDAQAHPGKWPSSLKDLQSLKVRPAIVVVVPEGTPLPFDSLAPPRDDYVINGQTFLRDLPIVVTRAVARVRGSQPASTTPNDGEKPQHVEFTPERVDQALLDLTRTAQADLERKLADMTAAFQHAQRRHGAAMAAARAAHELAATEQLTEQERQFQVQIALEREKRRTVEEMLSAATSAREEADRRIASALTDADAHARDMQQRHDAALTKAAGELAEQRTHLDRELSRAAVEGDQLRARLIKAELALEETRGELSMAEGRLSDTVREIEEIRASAARERTAAEQRLEVTLARESEAREILERKLTALQSAAVDVERGLRDEAAALRGQALEREASFEARLTSERLDYENRLAEIQSECGRLAQAGAAATADVQRLNADLSDTRRVLEERLKEETARHDAALQASERIRTELQQCLQAALAAGRDDIDQIQKTLLATLEGVRAATRRQATLQTQADRVVESHEAPESRATNVREARQPEIAAWHELSKDAALV